MAKLSMMQFLKDQLSKMPPVVRGDLTGRTVVVVGANQGLGFEAAKHFATMNPGNLVLVCRNRQKGEEAVTKIKDATGFQKIELRILDLSSFQSVKDFVNKYEEDGGRLDILIQNAGLMTFEHEDTVDGWESCLQVNNLSPALLILLLLPRMLETARKHSTTPRICVVSSDTHFFTSFDKEVLGASNMLNKFNDEKYNTSSVMQRRYMDTKLINLFFVRELNKRLSQTTPTIITNAIDPGYCYSGLNRNMSTIVAFLDMLIHKMLAFTTEEGSRQLVWGAVGGVDRENELRGGYVSKGDLKEVSDFVVTEEGRRAQKMLWEETIAVCGEVDSKIPHIVDTILAN